MTPPKVFVSYSHDSAQHKQWVLEFASTIRMRGIDAILDQWDLKPGDDLPHFMETHLKVADYVLIICTEKYVEKANAGIGGVGYEKMIMTSTMLQHIDHSKIVPVVRQSGDKDVPTFLETKKYIDFSSDEDVEYAYDELLRFLLGAPLHEKPEIGSNPFQPMEESRPDRTSDGVRQVMNDIAAAFEGIGNEYVGYQKVVEVTQLSRLSLDLYVNSAIEKGLVRRAPRNFRLIAVTPNGLNYLNERGMI